MPIGSSRYDDHVSVVLALGPDLVSALDAALGELGWPNSPSQNPPGSPEVVVVGERPRRREGRDVAETAARVLRGQGRMARIVRPPSSLGRLRALVPGTGADDWVSVAIEARGARLRSVRAPRDLTGEELVAAIDLQSTLSPLRIWSAHVHPLAGAVAGSSGSRSSLAADLALAFAPCAVLIGGTVGSLNIGVATQDLVAAELLTLGLRESGEAEVGPWEDPLVQRATELQLGITRPDQFKLVPRWTGPTAVPQSGALDALADRLRLRLGIPS